jgi:hypothetical protein
MTNYKYIIAYLGQSRQRRYAPDQFVLIKSNGKDTPWNKDAIDALNNNSSSSPQEYSPQEYFGYLETNDDMASWSWMQDNPEYFSYYPNGPIKIFRLRSKNIDGPAFYDKKNKNYIFFSYPMDDVDALGLLKDNIDTYDAHKNGRESFDIKK